MADNRADTRVSMRTPLARVKGLGASGHDQRIGMRHLLERPLRDHLRSDVRRHRLDALSHHDGPDLRVCDRQLRDDLERAHEIERRETRVQHERDRLLIVPFC